MTDKELGKVWEAISTRLPPLVGLVTSAAGKMASRRSIGANWIELVDGGSPTASSRARATLTTQSHRGG